MRVAKIAVAVVSLLVLSGSAYGWAKYEDLANGLTTADVIDPNAQTNGDQNILLVGLDNRTDAQGNPLPQDLLDQLNAGDSNDGGDNTDTMIVVHIPAGGGQATAFSIPRDSYVDISGGYGKHKINSAYTRAEVAERDKLIKQGVGGSDLAIQANQAGARNAIQTVEQFTGLTINHFASVNLVGFYYISEAVGGVPVCLKNAVDDPFSGAKFPAGQQTISGSQALSFVRQRHGLPGGDLDRIKRQQVFMASMAKTMLSAGTLTDPSKLDNLIDAIKRAVTLDKDWNVLGFARQMQSMSAGNIQFETIPVVNIGFDTPEDGSAVEVDPGAVQKFIQDATNHHSDSASTPTEQAQSTGNSAITVDVRNASGVTGLAAKVLQTLTGAGFTGGDTGNAAARERSVVDYGPGARDGADAVAKALGGMSTASDANLPNDHVVVYVGSGYSGPGTTTQQASAPALADSSPTDQPITAGDQVCIN